MQKLLKHKYTPVLLLASAAVLIQLLTLVSGTEYLLTQLTMSAWYVLTAIGLCVLMGYAGQISLGQAGFFAIGGYTTAVLTTINFTGKTAGGIGALLDSARLLIIKQNLYGETITHLNPWVSLPAALIIAAAAAWLIGKPVLRLKGHYLAMATMGFGIIINRIVLGTGAFGEADGISNVPGFSLLPGFEISGSPQVRVGNYYFAWLIIILSMFLLTNLVNSRTGRALRALHGSEDAADAMGVNTARHKLAVFILGAVFAAAAGFFMTHYNGGIGPSEAGVVKSVRYVAIVAVGGMANIWGTLIMGLLLNFLSLRGVFGHFDDAVFGVILVVIMMFMPEGFIRMAVVHDIRNFIRRRFKPAVLKEDSK